MLYMLLESYRLLYVSVCPQVNLCGGQVVNLPCSHVAHLFRARKPWTVESKLHLTMLIAWISGHGCILIIMDFLC